MTLHLRVSRPSIAMCFAMALATPILAQDQGVSACYERCSAEFSSCFGEPDPPDPPVPIDEFSRNGTVLTPPPYEFCLAQKQACDATCNAAYLSSRVKPSE